MKDNSIQIMGAKKKSALLIAEDALHRFPWAVNPLLRGVASLLSPFDHQLRLQVLRWENRQCEVKIPKSRKLRDHQNGIHPAVVGAVGERAAFFLLHRNFPFWRFVLELKEVQTVFEKSQGKSLLARCELDTQSQLALESALKKKLETIVRLKTDIYVAGTENLVAHVRTNWILKKRSWPWHAWNF